jgi:hypothetical protein
MNGQSCKKFNGDKYFNREELRVSSYGSFAYFSLARNRGWVQVVASDHVIWHLFYSIFCKFTLRWCTIH